MLVYVIDGIGGREPARAVPLLSGDLVWVAGSRREDLNEHLIALRQPDVAVDAEHLHGDGIVVEEWIEERRLLFSIHAAPPGVSAIWSR